MGKQSNPRGSAPACLRSFLVLQSGNEHGLFFSNQKIHQPHKTLKKTTPNSSIKFLDLESNHQVGVTLFTNDGSDFFPYSVGFIFNSLVLEQQAKKRNIHRALV